MTVTIGRRELLAALGGAAATWPLAARAQPRAMPVIGFLHAGSPSPVAPYLAEFRRALAETSYVENQNVAIEYRYADGQCDRLPELAGDLIRRRVVARLSGRTMGSQARTIAHLNSATKPGYEVRPP